jgi:hypothetical protein
MFPPKSLLCRLSIEIGSSFVRRLELSFTVRSMAFRCLNAHSRCNITYSGTHVKLNSSQSEEEYYSQYRWASLLSGDSVELPLVLYTDSQCDHQMLLFYLSLPKKEVKESN